MSKQTLNQAQQTIADEFCAAYGLESRDIFFEGQRLEPSFSYPALALLAVELGDFVDITTRTEDPDERGVVKAYCVITSRRGFTRTGEGSCTINSTLPDGALVENADQASAVARARALRHALTMGGFQPLRAHRARQRNEPLAVAQPPRSDDAQRRTELASIHAFRDSLGWSDSEYREKLDILFDVRSAADLSPARRRECIQILHELNALDEAGRAQRITFARGAKWERTRQQRIADDARLLAAA